MSENVSRPRFTSRSWVLWAATLVMLPLATQALADSKASAIAERTLEAMGGKEAWESTRFLRFNFFGARLHHWDRYTGRHRVEGETREGVKYLVLHNIESREGEVYLEGESKSGEEKKEWLERAYGFWVNDTYWLLMPYKLQDPGVKLVYDGEEEVDGTKYDKLKLTFNSVGLTPGDTYWAYVNRETGLMDRWAFFLENWEEGRAPSEWQWLAWDRYGKIKLSSRRVNPESGREAPLGELGVFDHMPDSVFESKEKPAL